MKIAVIDHVGNFGGGSRYIRNLLPALKKIDPHLDITFFGNKPSMAREDMLTVFLNSGIHIRNLAALRLSSIDWKSFPWFSKGIRLIQTRFSDHLSFLPLTLSGNLKIEIEKSVRGFDIAFFPWPYFLNLPQLSCPVVATFHDFNFKYFFGTRNFDEFQLRQLECQMSVWLQKTTPIVSSYFMQSEIQKFYPQIAADVNVIHLAPLCGDDPIRHTTARRTVAEMGIDPPYLIYPTNTCGHKNIVSLVSAVHLLAERGLEIKLVLTGHGTENLSGHACQVGIERGLYPKNIIGLGYVTNKQMDSLIKCATALVTTSLYEAGNGPGIDAWSLGVPVAMSDTPCFTEHLQHQNVLAEVFDPLNPDDIARKLTKMLTDPEAAQSMAARSQEAIHKLTWPAVAGKYLETFKKAANGKNHDEADYDSRLSTALERQ